VIAFINSVSFRFVVLPSSACLFTVGCERFYCHLITLRNTPQSVGLLRTMDVNKYESVKCVWPIPVAARTQARVCGGSLARTASSNSAGDVGGLSLVSIVCCGVKVSASG
jgi:hypothetical protein